MTSKVRFVKFWSQTSIRGIIGLLLVKFKIWPNLTPNDLTFYEIQRVAEFDLI